MASDLRRKEGEIDRVAGRLVRVGTELEESQVRVDRARDRQKELGRRARELDEALEEQEEAKARSRSRLEDQIRASYKGRDLEGLLLLVEGLFGGGDARGSTLATLQATRLLRDSSESIRLYEDSQQDLESTLQLLEQSKAEYRRFGEESQAIVEELEGRESELQASVEGLGLQRDRMEERLAELEAEEKAGLLKRPPATGERDERRMRHRDVSQDEEPDRDVGQDDKPGRNDGRKREEEKKEARERELEIAREDIETRPVDPIPYEEYVRLYKESAARYGFAGDWYVLAAVGKIESNHGENMGPSYAGAMGPMQFLPSTWSSYGVDGNGDGDANIMDPEDAIPAAASYLKAGGAPDDWYAALFTYNRAGWYVEEVLAIAESYRRIHGDDTVGPYLEAAPPPDSRAAPASGPTPRTEEVPKEPEESQQERPVEDAPPDKEPEPDDRPGTDEESTTGPGSPSATDEVTAEQYQY